MILQPLEIWDLNISEIVLKKSFGPSKILTFFIDIFLFFLSLKLKNIWKFWLKKSKRKDIKTIWDVFQKMGLV